MPTLTKDNWFEYSAEQYIKAANKLKEWPQLSGDEQKEAWKYIGRCHEEAESCMCLFNKIPMEEEQKNDDN